jgi:hypothetical protein
MESLQTTHVIMTLSLTIDSGGTLQTTLGIMTLNFAIDSDVISINNTGHNDNQQNNSSARISTNNTHQILMTLNLTIDSDGIITNNTCHNDTQLNNR